MPERREVLERIAAALERLAPRHPQADDWLTHPAYIWADGGAQAVSSLDTVGLSRLKGIDAQREAVCENIDRLASGASAHDMLLWGARGMGKSALLRAAIAARQDRSSGAIALVQISIGELGSLQHLLAQLAQIDRAFVLYMDDFVFAEGDAGPVLALRSLLDGGVMVRPANVAIAVTTNRRAIVARSAGPQGDSALNARDERDNALALADRFGLTLGFHPCDRSTYLDIVEGYTAPLGLSFEDEEAIAWSIARGNLSGRAAYQFACEVAGRAGKRI